MENTITKTVGGYNVEDFKILDQPVKRGILPEHIYSGTIKDVPSPHGVPTKDYYCEWDAIGRCSNYERKDCFIDVSTLKH